MIKSKLNLNGINLNEVKIENAGKIFLLKGMENSIVIEREMDKYMHIDFKIVDNIAFIRCTKFVEESKDINANIYITLKSEDVSISAKNIGSFQTEKDTYFNKIKLKIVNCGKINLLVESQSLFFNLQNVISFRVGGHTDKITFHKNNVLISNLRKLDVKND
ncbi:GIN domain-containing protein [Kaistella sp.]|uniref:GIN domain-containing protein n=1 Tax=Kaistella sp. TaxID=2782235 RepID=UPI003C3A22B4